MKVKNIIMSYILFIATIIGIQGQSKVINIESRRNNDKSIDIIYEKSKPGSYTVMIEFTKLENADITAYGGRSFNQKFIGTVDSNRGIVLKLRRRNPEQGISYGYTTSYIRGKYNPKVKKDFVYTLPFKKRTRIKVKDAGNLSTKYFDSELPDNWKSFVFRAKDSDTIVAVRKGLVIEVKDQYKLDTVSHFTSKKNQVLIEHKDGTLAIYKGFSKNGVLVKVGQTVYPQTSLGVFDAKGNKSNDNVLHFNISYLSDIKIDGQIKKKLKDKKSRSTYLNPNFLTDDGVMKLGNKEIYTVEVNEDVIFSEFTRREKKKYKKGDLLIK